MTALILAAYLTGVDKGLLTAICKVESGLNPDVVQLYDGRTHSYGLCQVKLGTARQMKYETDGEGLLNPYQNARVAAKYLKWQLKRYQGDTKKAVIAYNQGTYREGSNEQYYCKVRRELGKTCD